MCLSHSNTEHLLDLLEDAQATLALMLTSRHIGPLRDEAAAWAIKLKEISEVLEQVREKGSKINNHKHRHKLIITKYASLFINWKLTKKHLSEFAKLMF